MFELGEIVDRRYRVDKLLGSGANGSIFRCLDVDLERTCCIKVLKATEGVGLREQLRKEAAVLAALRHEHVVGVHAFGDHRGAPYFVMEYVNGNDLAQIIEEHYFLHSSQVPVSRATELLREICDGVSAVHGVGMIHRDIKPGNVIIEDRTGRVVLADFGAAVVARRWTGNIVGTPQYMAPELFRGAVPSPQGDLYAIGCLAFELLTGAPPYDADDFEGVRQQHFEAPVPRISERRAELTAYDTLFQQLLAKDPRERPGSAAALGNLFEDRARRGTPTSGGPISELVSTSQEGLRVLVVDDDPTFARMAARCVQVALPDALVSVSRAGTGAIAVANAKSRRPDLIILDYQLPDTNGVEILAEIRQEYGAHSEVLVASGALSQKERWRFHILGVRDFVDKPIDFAELVELIHRMAQKRAWAPMPQNS